MIPCRVRLLGEEVASQIAAGEVVERPASVVKELVENALDAGADRIVVEVEQGGRALIRVTDNGGGMTAQEAVLALQRHATSKIVRAEDLHTVRTLGFRGEALPSIASVSRLSLLTRMPGEETAVLLESVGGEVLSLEPAAGPEGTSVAVRDLFFNTPARLKFLKTQRTELGQICDVLTRQALSRPGIGIRLIADGEEVMSVPASSDPVNTVTALYGRETARELLPVEFARYGIAVEGLISRPTLTRPTRSAQHCFVNGRWIRNRTVTHAVDEAYRAAVPSGRHPFAVLHLELDPELVDVNIHPTKSEVRFLRDWEVHRAVSEAVRHALGGKAPAEPLTRAAQLTPEALGAGPWLPPPPPEPGPAGPAGSFPPVAVPLQRTLPELAAPLPALRVVAQLWNRYLVAEGPDGLLLVDQHLAHERVLFDRLVATGQEGPAPVHPLAPVPFTLGRREKLALAEWGEEVRRLGFVVEEFGGDSWVLRGAPPWIPAGGEVEALRRVLDELGEQQRETAAPPVRAAASAACRAAVKKGLRLGADELAQLLADLTASDNPHTCPHGCPIYVEISFRELLRRFKRI